MFRSRQNPAGVLACAAAIFLCLAASVDIASAAPAPVADDISKQIDSKNQEIQRLEEEVKNYRAALEDIGRQADTLQNQIQALDNSVKRLDTNIRITQLKISRTNLEIEELKQGIADKEEAILRGREELGHFLTALRESDQESLIEILLKNKTISSFFSLVDQNVGLQRDVQRTISDLRQAREDLASQKSEAEQKKKELSSLASDLSDEKALQEYQRRDRSNLLSETRNQERRYQSLLQDTERRRDALQQEINALEAGLKATFDVSALPRPAEGILGWPRDEPIYITQYFGLTAFARRGAYNGKGHNGIDLRASLGTPVLASDDGVVRAVGDTDVSCRRASYGRWILIDHPNNLSTLYAHLSLIKVSAGEAVKRGELIGYSGRSGYATGPHLHLTVFARAAVEVGELRSRACGRVMTLPFSPFGGYLNPLDYL